MKIYTKLGDQGSSQIGQKRLFKNALVFDFLGHLDELNASIGLVRELLKMEQKDRGDAWAFVIKQFYLIQNEVFSLGAQIHEFYRESQESVRRKTANSEMTRKIRILERWINTLASDLPGLADFILPGGGLISAQIHLTRTICRRTERVFWGLSESSQLVFIGSFLNRLSDYLFTIARWISHKLNHKDETWRKNLDWS